MGKYEEALERARQGLPIDEVFPELKASEDEKIRKEIIEFIDWAESRGSVRNDWHQKKRPAEWIAYLEKQKDFQFGYPGIYFYDGEKLHFQGNPAMEEEQKEQKPESCDCSRDEESYTNGIHHVLMNPEAYGLIKQKPAEQLGGTFTSYDMAKTFTEGQNYVIAHPEKFGLCKPAEWSEEDEHCIELLDMIIDSSALIPKNKMKCHAFLKSLRPQSHWKPSEEQMKVLEHCVNGWQDTADGTLESLYNDLKKLI